MPNGYVNLPVSYIYWFYIQRGLLVVCFGDYGYARALTSGTATVQVPLFYVYIQVLEY